MCGRAIIGDVNPRAALHLSSLACLGGLALLLAACGGASGSRVAELGSTATTRSAPPSTGAPGSARVRAVLAFARCMRAHGVPSFPDPDSQGHFPPMTSPSDQSKRVSLSAQAACKQLLPGGGAGTPQDRQAKFAFALKVARCLRAHGYPGFPDPGSPSQATSESPAAAGIDTSSPQFQAKELACENRERGAP